MKILLSVLTAFIFGITSNAQCTLTSGFSWEIIGGTLHLNCTSTGEPAFVVHDWQVGSPLSYSFDENITLNLADYPGMVTVGLSIYGSDDTTLMDSSAWCEDFYLETIVWDSSFTGPSDSTWYYPYPFPIDSTFTWWFDDSTYYGDPSSWWVGDSLIISWWDSLWFGGDSIPVLPDDLIEESFHAQDTPSTTVVEQAKLKLKMFPNPVTDWLTVNTNLAVRRLYIYSVSGEVVHREVSDQILVNHRVDLSSLVEGIYFVSVETLNDEQITSKIVVK